MDQLSVFAFLQSINVDYRRHDHSGKWLNIRCPLAPWFHAKRTDNTPSFGITTDPDKRSVFKCFGCNRKGRLPRLAALLGKLREVDYSAQIHWAELAELKASTSKPLREWDEAFVQDRLNEEIFIPDQNSEYAYEYALGFPYLRKRKLKWIDTYTIGIRYDPVQHRLLFPVYDDNRLFRGFSGRSMMPDHKLSKRNPKVRDYFGLSKRELLLGRRDIIDYMQTHNGFFDHQILVEGLFGYARSRSHGFNCAVAALGTSVTDEKIDLLIRRNRPVFLFFDNDKAGIDAVFGQRNNVTNEIEYENGWAYRLYKHIPVWICEYPEGTDGMDPADLTKEQYIYAVRHARLFSDNYLKRLISIG